MNNTKVIISGGGTGGHIFPALAIAETFKLKHPNTDILFVGAKGKMEMERVPKAGYSIKGLWISGFQRRMSLRNLSFPFKLTFSLFKALFIILKFKPSIAVGVGGYASGPILFVANILGIPTLIQEQNSYPGITNKILAKKVDKICVAYPNMDRFFPPNKLVFTGNPMRSSINVELLKRSEAYAHFSFENDKKTLVVMGGSLGARALNEAVIENLELIKELNNIQVLWQVGKSYWSEIMALNLSREGLKIVPFIERMDYAYAVGDLFVCRAGALTISELCNMGKPAVFVPSPNVSEDHQTKNALALFTENAALLINDKDIVSSFGMCLKLLLDDEQLAILSQNVKSFAKPKAASAVVVAMEELILNK